MYACTIYEQRLGSSRSIKRDPIGAGCQLQPSCRQQVATSRLSCAGHTLSSSSTSHNSAAHEHGAHQQQQQQQHMLHQQQHRSVVQPAAVPVAQLCQHSSTDAALAVPPTTAFYTLGQPSSSGSSNGGTPSTGLLGVVLPRTGLSGDNAGLQPSGVSSTADADSFSGSSNSNGVGLRHSSSACDSASAAQPAAAFPQPPSDTHQQQAQCSRGAKQRKTAAASGHNGTEAAGTSSKKQRSRTAHNKRGGRGSSDELSASKQLTTAIAQASCWQDLQRLLQQHSARMNHIHAAALLNTTSKLVQYHQLDPEQQLLFSGFYVDALQLAYTQAQGAARPRELSSMLWAVAKVGLHPGADWLAAYLAAVQPHLQAMNAQDVGLLVWALARFRLQPEPGFCGDLLAATQQLFLAACSSNSSSSGSAGSSKGSSSGGSSRQRPFDAQGLCNVLWGLAVLELSPGQEWLAAAAAAAEQPLRKGHVEPQGIAVMLWAMAKCGFKAQQAWLHAAADAAVQQLYAFKPAELSMLCHALARLHYQPPQAQQVHQQLEIGMQAQTPQGADADQEPGAQQQLPLLAQVQAVSWPQLQCLRFSEAANLLWALGVMGQQVSPGWVASALQQLQATLHEADAKALASACYGLAKLRHRGTDGWWEAVWQHVPHVMGAPTAAAAGAGAGDVDACSSGISSSREAWGSACCPYAASQSQATFLWAAAKLGAVPPAAVADSLFAASQQLLQQQAVNGAELMALTTAAAMLHLAPHSTWLHAADSMFGALLLHSCSLLQQQEQQQQEEQPELDVGQYEQQQKQVLHRLGSLLQQHSAVQEAHSQQQQQQAAALPHRVLKPSEVSNTVFSLARLRFVPSAVVLSALLQYVQQHGQHFMGADWQQLGRALQSWQDQLRQARKTATAAAAAVSGEAAGAACACSSGSGSNGSSAQAAEQQQGAVDTADNLHSSRQLAAAAVGALTSEACAAGYRTQQQQQLRNVVEGVHTARFAADGDLQGEEMLVYGKYLQLPLHSSSRDNSSLCVSGFQAAGAAAEIDRHAAAGAVPFRRYTSSTHQQSIALAGGLSVASG